MIKLVIDYSAALQILVFMSMISIIQNARFQNKILTMQQGEHTDKTEKRTSNLNSLQNIVPEQKAYASVIGKKITDKR